MQKYDFDAVYDRRGSGCYKADGLAMIYGREDLLPLWVADMDFAIAPPILQAMAQRLEHPIFGYNFRLKPYYDTVIDRVSTKYGWRIQHDWIINAPSIVTVINSAVLTLTSPGDGVLIQTPVYSPFFEAIANHNRKLLTNPLKLTEGGYEIDFMQFENNISQCRMFILCNPHNPVGRVWTETELRNMGQICKKHKVWVVTDEIHADLVFSGSKFTAFGAIEDFSDFTIACYSPAKSFNLAGLCTSAIIIKNEAARQKVNAYLYSMHLHLGNTFGITALQAAYSKGDEWLEALLQYLENNLSYLVNYFSEKLMPLKLIKPEGTYLAWIDCRNLGLTDDELSDTLINNCGLALSMGRLYGEDGAGFVRLNFATPLSVIKVACDKLFVNFTMG